MNAGPEQLPLRDIHLPEAVSWWPPAVGWWLVALVGLALAAMVWLLRRRAWRRHHDPTRVALGELERLQAEFNRDGDTRQLATRLSALLRRVSLTLFPRAEVAGLTGPAWLAFLDRVAGTRLFSSGPGRALAEVPFQPHAAADGAELLGSCRSWLEALGPRPGRPGP